MHRPLAGRAVDRPRDHPMIGGVVTPDSVPPPHDWPALEIGSAAELFAEAIARIHQGAAYTLAICRIQHQQHLFGHLQGMRLLKGQVLHGFC